MHAFHIALATIGSMLLVLGLLSVRHWRRSQPAATVDAASVNDTCQAGKGSDVEGVQGVRVQERCRWWQR